MFFHYQNFLYDYFVINYNSLPSQDIEYLVTLNVSLDTVSQRIEFVNGFFENNVTLNDSYRLTVIIVINETDPNPCKCPSSILTQD